MERQSEFIERFARSFDCRYNREKVQKQNESSLMSFNYYSILLIRGIIAICFIATERERTHIMTSQTNPSSNHFDLYIHV